MDDHSEPTVAPQSPNLNAVTDVEPLPSQHQRYRGSISHTLTPFTPTDAKSPWSRTPGPGWSQQQQQSSYFPPQPQPPAQHSYRPQQSPSQPSFTQNPFAAQANGAAAAAAATAGQQDPPWDPMAPSSRGNARLKADPDAAEELSANGGPRADVEVRTKFPVARIKRIMQSDEDVGKVAQVTPVVVSKALELFMIDLVTNAATEAKSRSSKRVTAAHLKTAVMASTKYSDWLGEIVSKAPDAPAASAKAAKDEADSDEEFFGSSGGGSGAKKKRRPAARRAKGGDDD